MPVSRDSNRIFYHDNGISVTQSISKLTDRAQKNQCYLQVKKNPLILCEGKYLLSLSITYSRCLRIICFLHPQKRLKKLKSLLLLLLQLLILLLLSLLLIIIIYYYYYYLLASICSNLITPEFEWSLVKFLKSNVVTCWSRN